MWGSGRDHPSRGLSQFRGGSSADLQTHYGETPLVVGAGPARVEMPFGRQAQLRIERHRVAVRTDLAFHPVEQLLDRHRASLERWRSRAGDVDRLAVSHLDHDRRPIRAGAEAPRVESPRVVLDGVSCHRRSARCNEIVLSVLGRKTSATNTGDATIARVRTTVPRFFTRTPGGGARPR